MRVSTRVLALVVVPLAFQSTGRADLYDQTSRATAQDDRLILERALKHENWFVQRRAIQLCEKGGREYRFAVPALFDIIESSSDNVNLLAAMRALEACDRGAALNAATTALRDAIARRSTPSDALWVFIARQGGRAGTQAAAIREWLASVPGEPDDLVLARVALAYVDGQSDTIDDRFVMRALEGDTNRAIVVDAIAMIGRFMPGDKRIAKALERLSVSEDRGCELAAAALANSLEGDSRTLVDSLRKRRDQVAGQRGKEGSAAMLAFAVARLSGQRQDLEIAVEIASFENDGVCYPAGHVWAFPCIFAADRFIDSRAIEALVGFLGGNDAKRRAGALNVLAFVGRRASHASSKVRDIALNDVDPNIRFIAAHALLYVGDVADLRVFRDSPESRIFADVLSIILRNWPGGEADQADRRSGGASSAPAKSGAR